MIINMDMYKMTSCYFPIFIILFCLVFAIKCVISMFISIKDIKNNYRNLLVPFFALVFTLYFVIYPAVISLINGGIYMLTEKPTDAIEIVGEIEEFTYPSQRVPNFKCEYGDNSLPFGVDITIDGKTYFMPYMEEFEVGDEVVITYLPKSKFLLSIDTLD